MRVVFVTTLCVPKQTAGGVLLVVVDRIMNRTMHAVGITCDMRSPSGGLL